MESHGVVEAPVLEAPVLCISSSHKDKTLEDFIWRRIRLISRSAGH